MLDKFAGYATDIRNWERRLKEMDSKKANPAKVKEIQDVIKELKNLLQEKKEKKEQRKKDKEQKAAETPSKEEVKVEAVIEPVSSAEKEAANKCTLCNLTFPNWTEYDTHRKEKHSTPPAVTSEQIKPAKLTIDSKVEPVRGENGSWGHVMREADTNGDPLCYVKWMEGPLKDKHGMGGYYPSDLKLKADETNPTDKEYGNIIEKQYQDWVKQNEQCPCWDDMSAYCPKCKSQKTSDLKSNYEDMLKDLKSEYQEAFDKHDHVWVARLEQKIKELEQKIQERFGNEKKEATKNYCSTCMLPLQKPNLDSSESEACSNTKCPDFGYILKNKEAGHENGSGGTERLVVMDHTPPRANSGPDADGKDSHDEFQDEWAMPEGIEMESAKGIPGSLFNAETAQAVADRIKSEVTAPYVSAQVSSLGGVENVAVLFTISADPKESWDNGILENSRYGKFYLYNDGTVEQFSGGFSKFKQPNNFLRKRNVKSVDQLIQVLNSFLDQVNTVPKTAAITEGLTYPLVMDMSKEQLMALPTISQGHFDNLKFDDGKHRVWVSRMTVADGASEDNQVSFETLQNGNWIQASLKKASISISVFNKKWSATPTTKEGKLSYEIIDNSGKKILSIAPLNGQEMNAEHLKWATERELTKGLKQARLTEDIAFMKKGSKVWILSNDGKRVKFANLEEGIRGYVSSSKIRLIALESQAVSHNGHSDKIMGSTATETLLDCIEGGPIWVNSAELLDANRPLATPESLNLEESKKDKGNYCWECDRQFKSMDNFNNHSCVKNNEKSLKEHKESSYGHSHRCPECGSKFDASRCSGSDHEVYCSKCDETGLKFKESSKDCPDCHGNYVGSENEKCPTCGRFSVKEAANKKCKECSNPAIYKYDLCEDCLKKKFPKDKKEASKDSLGDVTCSSCGTEWSLTEALKKGKCEICGKPFEEKTALKTALPPTIPNERAYLNNPPVEKQAGPSCSICGISFPSFPEFAKHKEEKHSHPKPIKCSDCGKSFETINQVEQHKNMEHKAASLNITAHIKHEDGKWVVYSHDYSKKLGTYDTKKEALHRLKSIEYWKSHKGSLVKGSDGKVYKIGDCNFGTDMVNLDEVQ